MVEEETAKEDPVREPVWDPAEGAQAAAADAEAKKQENERRIRTQAARAAEVHVAVPRRTTMFVGKIAATCDDNAVKSLLGACGRIIGFKRARHWETEEAKHFGFCDYNDPLGCLHAVEVLDGLEVDGRELAVMPNRATLSYLTAFKIQYRSTLDAALDADAGDGDEGETQAPLLDCGSIREAVGAIVAERGAARVVTADAADKDGSDGQGGGGEGEDRAKMEVFERCLREFEAGEEARKRRREKKVEKMAASARERAARIQRDEEEAAQGDDKIAGKEDLGPRKAARLAEIREDAAAAEREEREKIRFTIT